MSRVSIIIPVFNEAALLAPLLAQLEAVYFNGLETELIFVDDASGDGSAEQLKTLAASHQRAGQSIKVVHHTHNAGKGAALRSGFAQATGDFILIQDADLEYTPADYPALLERLMCGEASVVYGSRMQWGEFNRIYWLGNRLLTWVTNCLFGCRLTDMETCYKGFRAEVIQSIQTESNRFNIEPEITAKVLRAGHPILEVPIHYRGRNRAEGKKISWKDGFSAVATLFRYRYFPSN
jgi:glycosyltransferase involved in cell wall biosynthesis